MSQMDKREKTHVFDRECGSIFDENAALIATVPLVHDFHRLCNAYTVKGTALTASVDVDAYETDFNKIKSSVGGMEFSTGQLENTSSVRTENSNNVSEWAS